MRRMLAHIARLLWGARKSGEWAGSKRLKKLYRRHAGRPFVVDEGNLRFMHFNQKSVQSAMKIDAPDELLCGYTVAMMAFLRVNPRPERILMIGLGGGSLLKFCYRQLPACRITVLEIDADVIALRDRFMLPADDERLSVIHCDAIDYLAQNRLQVDVLLLDGFDGDGMVGALTTPAFFAACRQSLSPGGVLVVNMWGKRRILADLLHELHAQFKHKVWWCRSLDSYNLIAFAFREGSAGFAAAQVPAAMRKNPGADHPLARQWARLSRNMHHLPLAQAGAQVTAKVHAERELAILRDKVIVLMATDPALPRSDAEWSAAHQ